MRRRLPRWSLLLAVAASGRALAAPVDLTWRWPDDLAMDVRYTSRAEVHQGDGDRVLEVSWDRTMTVRRADDEVHVAFEGHDFKGILTQLGVGRLQSADAVTEAVVLTLAYVLPPMRIDARGRYVGILEPEAFLDGFFAEVSQHVGIPGIGSRGLRQLARSRLEQRAMDTWSALVAYWRDTSLEPGKVYPGMEPLGPGGDPAAGLQLAYSVASGVPCGTATCVSLTVDKKPGDALAAAMKQRSGPDATATEHIVLTALPTTLIPYQLVVERSTILGRKLEDGSVRTDRESSLETLRFTRR